MSSSLNVSQDPVLIRWIQSFQSTLEAITFYQQSYLCYRNLVM